MARALLLHRVMRISLLFAGGLALGLAPSSCAYESVVTAARVPVPVLVGPVSSIGGGPDAGGTRGAAFDVKVDHWFTVVSSNNGYTTTTTTTHVQEGAGKLDAAIRKLTNGTIEHAVHVDDVRVRAFSSFVGSGAFINSRVRVKGTLGAALLPMPRGWSIGSGER